MPKIVLHGKYSPEAWSGVTAEGATSREASVRAMFESLGASLEAMYMFPGANWDFMMIVDNASAEVMANLKKLVGPTGSVVEQNASVIMTTEEFDAGSGGTYRAPGQ